MNVDLMGSAMYITWCGLGVEICSIKESTDALVLYISVPKDSTDLRANHSSGNKMVGSFLAKRLKETLVEMGVKRLSVKYKIRDEVWNADKRQTAELAARQYLFGSQW